MVDDDDGVLASLVRVNPPQAAGIMREKDSASPGSAKYAVHNVASVRSL